MSEGQLLDPSELTERERLKALERTRLLDTPREEAFDRLTMLACALLGTPVALVSLVDTDRQFFKSQQGLPEPWASRRETPLSHSFCQHVVTSSEPLVIADSRKTPLVCENLAVRDLNVIAYLGVPLISPDGHVLGSLCAIDSKPREWTQEAIAQLMSLAECVLNEIALRQELSKRQEIEAALRQSEAHNRLLAQELNHRVKNAITTVQAVVRQTLHSANSLEQAEHALGGRLSALSRAHDLLMKDDHQRIDLTKVVDSSLSPFKRAGVDNIRATGPTTLLPGNTGLIFAMALHELATNALKYGALLSERGSIDISWQAAGPQRRDLEFTWAERGGPPVSAPGHQGFGSVLIKRILAQALNGKATIVYSPDGLTCTICGTVPAE